MTLDLLVGLLIGIFVGTGLTLMGIATGGYLKRRAEAESYDPYS